jgi:glyoxylase-like metal-dependent hydrolase (beta-lactamase superfamily II)
MDWPFGTYPEGGLERLGPHVTAYYGEVLPLSNSAIVRGSDATLVFDANVGPAAAALRAEVDRARPPLRYLVLSHVHTDHTLGAMMFSPPARVLARSYTRDRLARWAADPSTLPAGNLDNEVRIVVPEEVVDAGRSIDLGGVTVHLHAEPTPAHTKADLWAVVEPDGVVLCGDLWFKDCEPYLGSGSPVGALAAIQRLRDARGAVYLPGHGPSGTLDPRAGEDPVERYVRWVLRETRRGVRRGLSGADLGAFVGERFGERVGRLGSLRIGRSWIGRRPRLAFPVSLPGSLEDSVAAAERDVRGAETGPRS